MFPNLARRKPEKLDSGVAIDEWACVCSEVDTKALAELEAAGIPVEGPHEFLRERGEVPFSYLGSLHMWSFRRAWYYWVAEGPGIPSDKAMELHREFGTQCRVDGHCACPSPVDWWHGFAVGMYHVDTQEGLNALAALLKSIYIPTPADVL